MSAVTHLDERHTPCRGPAPMPPPAPARKRPKKPTGRYGGALDAAARLEILACFREAKGIRVDVAKLMGVSTRTLYREIDRLNLRAEIDREAERHGWPAWGEGVP